MHVKEFYINNFRGYRNFRLKTQKNTNLLTGVNNSGKTTILEAISLWNEIFHHLISIAQRKDGRLNINTGDFRFNKKNSNFLDYRQINSVRSFGYLDVFFNLDPKATIELSAIIEVSNSEEIEIGFIMKEAIGNNYNVYLRDHDSFDFTKFNNSFTSLPNSIGCYFSSPVATISSYEEFSITPKIKEGIKTRQSFLYFRNRLYNLMARSEHFNEFKNQLSRIIYDEINQINFDIRGDRSIDINITVNVDIKGSGYRDVSLLGSGTIQIIEILLHLFEQRKELNIILLDEPDSHIHRDIQKRLLKFLLESDVQVFLTTHNESLIRSANPKNIYFIDETVSTESETIISPISNVDLPKRNFGISNTYHSKIISQLGSETSLDILNAFEAEKIFFIEGTSDSVYIQKIIDINSNDNKEYLFWTFRGINNLISKISYYKEFLEGIGSNVSLWNKSALIIDSDFMTETQRNNLSTELNSKLDLPIFLWSSYTIEATLLSDRNTLKGLIYRVCTKKEVPQTEEVIENAINNAFNDIKNIKLEKLENNEQYSTSIAGQLTSRVSNLNSSLNISRSAVYNQSDASIFNHYRIYAIAELNSGRIDHICDKEDVESVLNAIYTTLTLVLDPTIDNHFSELFTIIDSQIQYSQWNELMSFIRE